MPIYWTLAELHHARKDEIGKTCGLVPTMGALHQGHLSLIEKALDSNECVWVTIFVNPTQFNKKEDLEKYPSDLMSDVAKIEKLDASIRIFAPSINEMYPNQVVSATHTFDGLDAAMEGADRPGHFEGVITIISKLFEAIQPQYAYFGEKDFQQLQIIKNWAHKHAIPTKIVGCPIVREAHGLAMSSRNALLSSHARLEAGFIYKTLQICVKQHKTKSAIYTCIGNAFDAHPSFKLHYVLCVQEETLQEVDVYGSGQRHRLFVAASVEGVRLIDNIALK